MSTEQATNHTKETEKALCRFLIDREVRENVAFYIKDWMFAVTVYKAIAIACIDKDFTGKDINPEVLLLKIKGNKNNRFSSEDYVLIKNILDSHRKIETRDLSPILNIFENFIKDKLTNKGIDMYVEGKTDSSRQYFEKAVNFKLCENPFYDLSSQDVAETLKSLSLPSGGSIKSSISIINDASVYKGFKRGDLCMVVAPPKVGKTTLLTQEPATAAKQGFKVVHMCFGDMDNYDILCKYVSHLCAIPMEIVIEDAPKYMNDCKDVLQNIRASSFPAGQMSVYDVVGVLKRLKREFNYDVVVIDYDSNIQSGSDNMYESGGITYTALKGLAESENCVVFVGSQPVKSAWGTEILGMESAAESSRKQHAVDYMITMGRNSDCKSLGTLNLACIRRGEGGVKVRLFFDYKNSRIKEISKDEYDRILKEAKSQGDVEIGDSFTDPIDNVI